MEEQHNDELTNSGERWCILRHPHADLIGEIFSGKLQVYNATGDDTCPLPPFDYFIPFEDLKLRQRKPKDDCPCKDYEYHDYDAMLDEQALRCDLHHFIFIHEPKETVQRILNSPWNRVLSHRLYAYRDEKGDPVEISNAEVERFKTVIKRYDFQIVNGEPTDEVREGDQVTVVSGPMKGSDGVVQQIRERDGQILLTVIFTMFQDKMRVAVPGILLSDVRLNAPETAQLLQDPVITHFEDELIELLCHLHGKKGSQQLNKDDQKRLRFLYQYSDIEFEDNSENRIKFSALMLICAYLLNDKQEIATRLKEVEHLLSALSSQLSDSSLSPEPSAPGSQPSAFSPQPSSRGSRSALPLLQSVATKRNFTFHSSLFPSNCGSKFFTFHNSLSSELQCYLLTAQFIVTHNPELRKQVKLWRQSHPDCPLAIRRFLSIAKQIRC